MHGYYFMFLQEYGFFVALCSHSVNMLFPFFIADIIMKQKQLMHLISIVPQWIQIVSVISIFKLNLELIYLSRRCCSRAGTTF